MHIGSNRSWLLAVMVTCVIAAVAGCAPTPQPISSPAPTTAAPLTIDAVMQGQSVLFDYYEVLSAAETGETALTAHTFDEVATPEQAGLAIEEATVPVEHAASAGVVYGGAHIPENIAVAPESTDATLVFTFQLSVTGVHVVEPVDFEVLYAFTCGEYRATLELQDDQRYLVASAVLVEELDSPCD